LGERRKRKDVPFSFGKIGGGKPGIGQGAFKDFYTGDEHLIQVEEKSRLTFLIAKLSDRNFGGQVADFVWQVAKFKNPDADMPAPGYAFNAEFDGQRHFGLPDTITADANHGIVVNQLREILVHMGWQVGNNGRQGRIDLFIYNEEEVTHLFEVKTSLSLQNVYTAIGQLFMYSHRIQPRPRLLFVCPEGIPRSVSQILDAIGIRILTFRLDGRSATFSNIVQTVQ
jgi:hypothetical protein